MTLQRHRALLGGFRFFFLVTERPQQPFGGAGAVRGMGRDGAEGASWGEVWGNARVGGARGRREGKG